MKKFFILFFVFCGPILSNAAKGMAFDELEQVADKAARSAYARINQNWKYPENNNTPVTCTTSWEEKLVRTSAGYTSMVCWNPEEQPCLSAALEEIFNAPLIMDCSNAARLVRLYMICKMLGEEKTSSLISSTRRQHPDSQFNFMNALSWSFIEKVESTEKGGIYCFPFANIEKYSEYKPGGHSISHNIIRLLDKGYLGFEPSFFTSPKSHEDLEQLLYNCFITPEEVASGKEAEHQKYSGIVKDLAVFKRMREIYQERVGFYKLNVDKVKSFIEG
jgi:hypothetical protein